MRLPRVLEAEVMDGDQEAADYDAMDFSEVNRRFVSDFLAHLGAGLPGPILDVGTGTALIPVEFCRQSPRGAILAVDLSESMLARARINIDRAGCGDRVTLEKVNARGLPYPDGHFAAVMSNSIVHHVPEPRLALAEMARVVTPGGCLFVRDLSRPESLAELRRLVGLHAAGADPRQRQLFADSLHAALTVDEIRDVAAALGYEPATVRATSDRHWTWAARRPAA